MHIFGKKISFDVRNSYASDLPVSSNVEREVNSSAGDLEVRSFNPNPNLTSSDYVNPVDTPHEEEGEFDTSDACLVVVYAIQVKHLYDHLIDFSFNCRQKRCLTLFDHPGEPGLEGGLSSIVEGKQLEEGGFYCKYAIQAISQFNSHCENMELKLVKLIRVTSSTCAVCLYMTLTAIDEVSGKSGIYQAALHKISWDEYVLGLFRDVIRDKVLAIMSITGSEEDLAAKKKLYEECLAERT